MFSRSLWTKALLLAALVTVSVAPALARQVIAPVSDSHDVMPVDSVDRFTADRMDVSAALIEDLDRDREGLPPRFAIPQETFIAPDNHGTWEQLDGGMMAWRLRIEAPGAVSLNLGFTAFHLPVNSHLNLYPADGSAQPVTFTADDNKDHRQLWTPVVETDDLMVEVVLPVKERWNLELELTSVNVGYRKFGELTAELMGLKQGTCNNDVVCPVGDGWRDDIQSVGAISTGGSAFCTGFMVNNTAGDETPYFMTAYHCGITSGNAASLVVYWNFESPNCGDLGGGSLADFQTGSTFRAGYSASDFTLVELDDLPDPNSEVAYAGWDNGSQDATSAVGIHHPNGDEKAISFEYDPTTTTSYLSNAVPGDGTHVRITDWDDGTTEPGSSGSPLFDQNHRIIGQLHGGYAACNNDLSDWYGRFSVSWTGGGSSSNSLQSWLDPLNSGAQTVDLLAPYAAGISVTAGSLDATGDIGGPFLPTSKTYTLTNRYDASSVGYSVSVDQAWVDLSSASGTIAAGGTADVTVSLNSGANTLSAGVYTANVSFTNTTDGVGDTQRQVRLTVGSAGQIYAWTMDTNPGWTTQGQWAWGQPTGNGGADHGDPDPTSGATGSYVYGYNLSGDYANNMAETHLTTTAIDCSQITGAILKFQRWLNVEQPAYDHAYVRVSNDGVNWTQLWTNGAEITDTSWLAQEFDISAVADGQATVYVRWTMGTTDSSWLYAGWNVDDVEIWGFDSNSTSDAPSLTNVVTMDVSPNPFNPMTEVHFNLPRGTRAVLGVYDLRGQLIRSLEDSELPAGDHVARWDGTDASGRGVSSGSYLFRLEAAGQIQVRKALLVR